MIIIPHNQGVISSENIKKVPLSFVARISDGSNWTYFETEKEYENYKSSLPIVDPVEEKSTNQLSEALKNLTPEEIEEFKALLNK